MAAMVLEVLHNAKPVYFDYEDSAWSDVESSDDEDDAYGAI